MVPASATYVPAMDQPVIYTPVPESALTVVTDPLCCDPYCNSSSCQQCTPQQGYLPGAYGAAPYYAAHETWQLMPGDLIWHSYWAGAKESRISGALFEETNGRVSLLDVTLGGRSSLLRYGPVGPGPPVGWELQIEGAGMLQLDLDNDWDFESTDFWVGVPLIYGQGDLQWKIAYYHLSSHVGDEFLVRNLSFSRINFSRDVLVLGVSLTP